MFLQKLIFLCAIPFAAFSGKEKLSINEGVSGIVLIYRNGETLDSKKRRTNS